MKKFTKKVKEQESSIEGVVPWDVDPAVTIVIDMDEQVFITAAACEEKLVEFTNVNSMETGLFKNRTQFKKFMEGIDFDPEWFTCQDIQKAEKINFAISTLRNRINKIMKVCKCHPDNAELYIDGGNNFRTKLPLAVEYKGNRKDNLKPLLLKDLKEYAINVMHSIEVTGMETDDMVCIRVNEGYQNDEIVIGVTQDKDARQVEGRWFNYEKEVKPKLVEGFGDLWLDTDMAKPTVKGEGWKFLYYQLIHADTADNYCSRDTFRRVLVDGKLDESLKKPRWGEKTAKKELDKCSNHKQCLELIVKKYKQWYGEGEFEYMDYQGAVRKATWLDILDMQFQLAYMKRSLEDNTCIKDVLKKVKLIE